MEYQSTRGETPRMGFQDAVVTGLAPDGGLLVPTVFPDISDQLTKWKTLSFTDLAKVVVAAFVDDMSRSELDPLVEAAYSHFDHPDVVGLVPLGNITVLELFHGPTLAFKDIALQLLGQLFAHILAARGEHLNILGATSGDTGSAAIAGVQGQKNVDIFVMFPEGRVSPLQELQMTTVTDANVHCLRVTGSFDDCQNLMKTTFGDLDFKQRYHLGAVNSVNWARVLAQVVYYGYASLKVGGGKPVSFAVPTGNFGNVFAGYVARRIGFPIGRLIVATNENDILSKFFQTGRYASGPVHHTVTPAMDIQVASNFERYLFYYLDQDPKALQKFMKSFTDTGEASLPIPPRAEDFVATAVKSSETLDAIKKIYRESQYIADPHTAVGMVAANKLGDQAGGEKIVCVATAHPAKFPESVDKAIGAPVARHARLEALRGRPTRCASLRADLSELKAYISLHAR